MLWDQEHLVIACWVLCQPLNSCFMLRNNLRSYVALYLLASSAHQILCVHESRTVWPDALYHDEQPESWQRMPAVLPQREPPGTGAEKLQFTHLVT